MAPRTPSSKGPKAETAMSHARAPQQMRIIGRRYRRMPLPVIDTNGLRPTSDRVCEAVFNQLGHDLIGWRCADVFAGTGALGFEAASRGAAHMTLMGNYAQAVRALHAIRDKLGVRMVDIVSDDAFAWLACQPDAALDAVFIDPPFTQDWTLRASGAAARVVEPGGMIYVEAAQQLADVSAGSHGGEPVAGTGLLADLVLHKHLRAGAVHAYLLLRKNGQTTPLAADA